MDKLDILIVSVSLGLLGIGVTIFLWDLVPSLLVDVKGGYEVLMSLFN